MAEVLIWLVIGGTIGWFLRRNAERRLVAEACSTDLLAAQWAEHVEMHAEAQKGSVVMTAPEAMVYDLELLPPSRRLAPRVIGGGDAVGLGSLASPDA